ncbi:sensor histidine kinase [Corynebacterium fournieri]|uniref:sensor histidine kinase n=1 Tax=Corynebacterium fournieri TaxID=1852390 RepID=UPI0025B3B850|nr:HAMP domain-containing sensor histidine kinase [Corynebacterium fournieri]WJY97246.1 Sensor kinase CusS [Corynebacterium fournieri]
MRKLSLRARITVMFVATVLGVGCALIGLVYAYLKLTPVPVMAEFPAGPDGVVIDGAVPVTDEILHRILTASLGALALLTALAGVVGWFVAGLVITPLRAIADDAREVTRGNLAARIDYDGPRDEVGELSEALNAMLDELADAVERQRRFAANASHELKTPIATIQTVADVALSGEDADLRPALSRIREVNARSATTVSSLLQLANVQVRDRTTVDLAAVCREVGAERGVLVDAAEVSVQASPALVRQAVDNLVRNAVVHGAPGTARLSLRRIPGDPGTPGAAEITVVSGGDVLAPEEVATWTEPFARARRTSGEGHGLGLALVKAIAKAHGGSVELSPRAEGGLVVRLLLPA